VAKGSFSSWIVYDIDSIRADAPKATGLYRRNAFGHYTDDVLRKDLEEPDVPCEDCSWIDVPGFSTKTERVLGVPCDEHAEQDTYARVRKFYAGMDAREEARKRELLDKLAAELKQVHQERLESEWMGKLAKCWYRALEELEEIDRRTGLALELEILRTKGVIQ
jgi:catalase